MAHGGCVRPRRPGFDAKDFLMLTGPITIAQAIQISVAPVFLLTGVAALTVVYTTRLGRIIDRIRSLRERGAIPAAQRRGELDSLARRARFVHAAIGLAVLAGVFVSAVIGVIFFGYLNGINLIMEIAFLFLTATFLLTLSLLSFLLEVNAAARWLRAELMAPGESPSDSDDAGQH
jgi:hypothetical protein